MVEGFIPEQLGLKGSLEVLAQPDVLVGGPSIKPLVRGTTRALRAGVGAAPGVAKAARLRAGQQVARVPVPGMGELGLQVGGIRGVAGGAPRGARQAAVPLAEGEKIYKFSGTLSITDFSPKTGRKLKPSLRPWEIEVRATSREEAMRLIRENPTLRQERLRLDREEFSGVTEKHIVVDIEGNIREIGHRPGKPPGSPVEQLGTFKYDEMVAKMEPAPTVRAAPVTAPTVARLPRELAGAKPGYNIGRAQYTPQFESDVDRALFIVSQTKKSARDESYMEWLRGQLPDLSDVQLRAAGRDVRAHIKATVSGQPEGNVAIPDSRVVRIAKEDLLTERQFKAREQAVIDTAEEARQADRSAARAAEQVPQPPDMPVMTEAERAAERIRATPGYRGRTEIRVEGETPVVIEDPTGGTGGPGSGAGAGGGRLGGGPPQPPIMPAPDSGPRIMGSLSDFGEAVDIMTRPDVWRKLANMPGMRTIMGTIDPAAVANNPAHQAVVGRAMLRDQSPQLTQAAMVRLNKLGTQENIFGKLTTEGKIADGPLRGLTVNTIRTYPDRYASKMTPAMKAWVKVADDIEKAKLQFLKDNGIDINELVFDEGGRYAGRRVYAKTTQNGEVLDIAFVGAGPARPGAKLAAEKTRRYANDADAIADGFLYIPDDEALFLNVQGAFNRVADKKMVDWILEQVPWRTMETPEAIKVAKAVAERRFALAKRSIESIQRAIRGESLPTGTVNAIERLFPQLEGRLRGPTRVHLDDVLKAAKTLEQPERVLEVPTVGAFMKVQRLLGEAKEKLLLSPGNPALQREVSRLEGSLGFMRYRMGVGEPITLPHNVVKALREDALGDLREILDAIRGTRVKRPGKKGPRFEGGLIDDVRKEVSETTKKSAEALKKAQQTALDERRVDAPAFAGKIFTGPEAAETARILRESMSPEFNAALNAVGKINQFNSVSRYFQLAGDVSPMAIQLLYLAGSSPKSYVGAGRGFLSSMLNPRFHAKYLAKPENLAILQKYPNLIITKGGATEFTEAMGRGGILRPTPKSRIGEVATLPLKIAGKVLEPFQRGFEGALDVAGVEMAKSLDHYGTTAARINDVTSFVNNFRGVTSSSRLGVSFGARQAETMALLAPRYNRAIAGLVFDTVHGGLKGHLARRALAQGVGAVALVAVAISIARGESEDEILRHFRPADPSFMTWKIGGQNIGPGTKVRSLLRLFGLSAQDPERLLDTSVGWGKLEYMKNPILKFGRGLASPVASTSWDLVTGKDFIGDPTRDGLLSFTKTMAETVMPIWTQTVAFEGGTPMERVTRGSAEFFGMRAYPRNLLFELDREWKDELSDFNDIPTDPNKIGTKEYPISRTRYRQRNPMTDAKLFILGDVTSLMSIHGTPSGSMAIPFVLSLIREHDIDPDDIRGIRDRKDDRAAAEEAGRRLTPNPVDRLIGLLEEARPVETAPAPREPTPALPTPTPALPTPTPAMPTQPEALSTPTIEEFSRRLREYLAARETKKTPEPVGAP